MAANKTVESEKSVTAFLKTIKDKKKSSDCSVIIEKIAAHTKMHAKMWGTAIVGFGSYHYKYESGREGDAPLAALSPRANAITVYLHAAKDNKELMQKLGKYQLSGGCVHIKTLEDIDIKILLKLIDINIKNMKAKYPAK